MSYLTYGERELSSAQIGISFMIAHISGSVLLSIVFLHFKFTSKEKVTFAQDKGK